MDERAGTLALSEVRLYLHRPHAGGGGHCRCQKRCSRCQDRRGEKDRRDHQLCDGYHTEPDPDYNYHEIVPIEEVARPKTHLKIVNKTLAPNTSGGYNVLVDGKLFYDTPQSYADKYVAGAVLVDEDIYGKEIAFVHYTAAQHHSYHILTADVTYSIEGGIYGATKELKSLILQEGGKLVLASDAEYTDFKSHMETEIENILTPIEEEGE